MSHTEAASSRVLLAPAALWLHHCSGRVLNEWTSHSNSSISLRLHPIRFPREFGSRPLLGSEHWLPSHQLSPLACQRLEKHTATRARVKTCLPCHHWSCHIPFFFFIATIYFFKKIKVKPFHSTVFHGVIRAKPWVPSSFVFRGLCGCGFLVWGALQ